MTESINMEVEKVEQSQTPRVVNGATSSKTSPLYFVAL